MLLLSLSRKLERHRLLGACTADRTVGCDARRRGCVGYALDLSCCSRSLGSLSCNLDIVLLARHMTLLFALGLISQIWIDLWAQRQADESPAIPTRVTRRRDAGNRGDLPTASAREPGPSTSPATGTSPAICPARTTRRRDAGRVEVPRQADARWTHPSAREYSPLAAVEAYAELPLSAWCAAHKVVRIRGGGGLGDAGVPPEHKSDRNRQPSVLSPAPALSAAWGSSSATSTSLPHTLERRGYTGTEEECSETESWPMLDTVD